MRRIFRLSLGLLAAWIAAPVLDAAPAAERLFGLTNLWEFHLTLAATNWDALTPPEPRRASPGEPRPPGPGAFDREFPWSVATFEGAGQVLTNVALRFKGNSSFNMSRNGLKRPFRLDFNRGAKGRSLLGHEELLLNNNVNDGTQFREVLAYEAFRRAGLPSPRTALAQVYLTVPGRWTNEYLGLYTVVEAVEGGFLKRHFATNKGLLVKPDRLPGLKYLGEHWSAYTNRYAPKTKADAADTRRFIALTRVIDTADDATFRRELPRQLDVTNLLRFVAVNGVLANYDSFIGTGHNYYLFQPRDGAPARFIPWDLNEAFGGHPGAGDRRTQAGFSVLRPLASPNRLVERVLADPEWAVAYRREVTALMTNAGAAPWLLAEAQRLADVTQAAVFAESPQARAAFQRTALGLTNTPPLPVGEDRRAARPSDGGPGPGPRPGRLEDMSFAEWVNLRAENIAAELAGTRTAPGPQMNRRPPGRPQLGGPGGLVPPPGRDSQPPRPAPDRAVEPK